MCPSAALARAANHADDIEMFNHLQSMMDGGPVPENVLPDVNPCTYRPWDLPKEKLYFFNSRDAKSLKGIRVTDVGYWQENRSTSTGSSNVGMITSLEFYKGQAPHGDRTDWMMLEYTIDRNSLGFSSLSRVFNRSDQSHSEEHPQAGSDNDSDSELVRALWMSLEHEDNNHNLQESSNESQVHSRNERGLPKGMLYFFNSRDAKSLEGIRFTEVGYWQENRSPLTGSSNVGMITSLEFYMGQAPHGDRTDWMMIEYTIDRNSSGFNSLSRVFNRSDQSHSEEHPRAGSDNDSDGELERARWLSLQNANNNCNLQESSNKSQVISFMSMWTRLQPSYAANMWNEALNKRLGTKVGLYYEEAYAALNVQPLNQHFDRTWISHVQLKAAQFYSEACYRSGLELHEKEEIAEEIARLRSGITALTDAKKSSKGVAVPLLDAVTKLEANLNRNLERAMKENDRVYLMRVPAASSLSPLPSASLVKPTPMNDILNASSVKLFTTLVPDTSAKALS